MKTTDFRPVIIQNVEEFLILDITSSSDPSAAFSADFSNAFSQAAVPEPSSPKEADLLGLSSDTVAAKVEPAPRAPPSNFDLLAGVQDSHPPPSKPASTAPDLMSGMTDSSDSFDPFASFTSNRMKVTQPSPSSAPPPAQDDMFSSFSSFDPFASSNPAPQKPLKKPAEPDIFDPFKTPSASSGMSEKQDPGKPDLLGAWSNMSSATNHSTVRQNQSNPNFSNTTNDQTNKVDPFANLASFNKSVPKTLNGMPQVASKQKPAATSSATTAAVNSSANASWQAKGNYSINLNPNQQTWKASK